MIFILIASLILVSTPSAAGDAPPLRWGIMGAGKICSDFVGALKGLNEDEAQVVAVGARA